MFYRSDWAEAGFTSPFQHGAREESSGTVLSESGFSGSLIRWLIRESVFETSFYGFPVKELVLEISGINGAQSETLLKSNSWRDAISHATFQVIGDPALKGVYLFSKVLREEPLYKALLQNGFQEVESRKLYGCRFRDLETARNDRSSPGEFEFCTLETLSTINSEDARSQILDLCRRSFERGHTRHYVDSFLSDRKPGVEYILALMELNFRNLPPENFLVAVDTERIAICGFSVIGRKPGIDEDSCSQLLSAVSPDYRGRGLYRRLSFLAAANFPPDSLLLNVTHSSNLKIQRAYRDSGRRHTVDTFVLRRVF